MFSPRGSSCLVLLLSLVSCAASATLDIPPATLGGLPGSSRPPRHAMFKGEHLVRAPGEGAVPAVKRLQSHGCKVRLYSGVDACWWHPPLAEAVCGCPLSPY